MTCDLKRLLFVASLILFMELQRRPPSSRCELSTFSSSPLNLYHEQVGDPAVVRQYLFAVRPFAQFL